jgi:LacI family transcriptional regulator
VAGDDASGVDAAVVHLAELGHREIAHVTGPLTLSTTLRRLEALEAAARRLGLEMSGRVVHGDSFTEASGRRAAAQLIDRDRDFTAILAGNDLIALGCLEALAEAGLRCPDDVSIVGHNDTPMVANLQPPLTTVAIPQREIGTRAARLILDRLEGKPVDPAPVLLPTELVVRGSTGPARPRKA